MGERKRRIKYKGLLFLCLAAVVLLTAACKEESPAALPTLPTAGAEVPDSAEPTTGETTMVTMESALEASTATSDETTAEAPKEKSTDAPGESLTEPISDASGASVTEPISEASSEAATESFTNPTATLPAEESSAETTRAGGLWTPVPTMEADWATRAVGEAYYTNRDFGFYTYVSPYDYDGDGIEDQADILQGARDYVATRPEYDASYFETGWPPAGKGVCTDVFAYAMLAAGYNMQKLVDRDVHLRPYAYEWEVGDPKIDFRRTRNLLVFCDQYLERLTLDPYDYEAWQPGDIVIFAGRETGMWPGHIAIVSDRRAADGLPYLIHHTDNDRYSYEQDFLTTPQRYIRGHHRVGNLAAHSELFEEP